ncbi:MAG: dTDP-4-dehydrorhamnose reductase [Candidatus Muiribacteriota bacterium]|jgi:dTDP-4-dehydrorhamnose reductase
MKNIVITGAKGLLGKTLYKKMLGKYSIFEADLPDMDITSEDFFNILDEVRPDVIINCAAMTNVDKCEDEKENAYKINALSVKKMADFCQKTGAFLVHYSTDYIFDGKKGQYNINDIPNPLGVYGLTKLISEYEIIKRKNLKSALIRTNVVYGNTGEANFIVWLYNKLKNNESVNIVDDQFNNPCFVEELADFTIQVIDNELTGIFHTGSPEFYSRYDFSRLFAQTAQFKPELINKISTSQLNQKAQRPLKGGLDIVETEKITGFKFKSTHDNFKKLIEDFNK